MSSTAATQPALDVPVLAHGQVVQVPVAMLQPDPHQPRTEFEREALNALAADIAARGIELPIVVRGDYTIKDGERRWRAAKIANLATVPCLLAGATAGEEGDFAVNWKLDQVADNHHREPLNPLDWARFLRELVDVHGIAVKDVPDVLAKRGITMSRSYVSNLIRLVELPDWAKDLIKDGRITAAHGKHILTAKDSPAATEALRKRIVEHLKHDHPIRVTDLPRLIRNAFVESHPDLDAAYGDKAPRFDTATCKGCASRKVLSQEWGEDVFCLDIVCFQKKQAAVPAKPIGNTTSNTTSNTSRQSKPDPRAAAAAKRVRLVEKAKKVATERVVETIVAKAGALNRDDMLIILDALIDWQNINAIAKRRGWEIKSGNGNWLGDFHKRVESMSMQELQGLVVEAALHSYKNPITSVAKRRGIDIKAIETAALNELTATDKKPDKKAAKKKPSAKKVAA